MTESREARDLVSINELGVETETTVIAYHILRDEVAFADLGADQFDRMNLTKARR